MKRKIFFLLSIVFFFGAWFLNSYNLNQNPLQNSANLAEERASFSTKLLWLEQAPQKYKDEVTPPNVQEVKYQSGNLLLKAWMSKAPQDGKKHPAVVYLHGGFSFAQSDWDVTVPYLNARFVVMTPMLRGENGNPGNFEFFYGEVDDAIAAGHYVSRLPYVDAEKVFVSGHSIGGTLSMLSAMLPSPFAAAASFSGSPEQKSYFESWKDYVPFDLNNPQEIHLRSPIEFPDSIRHPLFLFAGSSEEYFIEKNRQFGKDCQKLGKTCKVFVVEGDHSTALPPSIEQSIQLFLQVASAKHKS
jgi:dipeptidyl aminopeptidase/acylaminoacyl peptidase